MRLILFFLAAALIGSAQDYRAEASGSIGGGARGAEDIESGGYWTWTAGGGYRLSDRWLVKGEYAQHRPNTINMFTGSLMREWEGDRGRPFAEFGVGAGFRRFRSIWSVPGSGIIHSGHENTGYLGILVAGGATFDIGERYFIRPQVRVHLLGPIYLGIQPAIAAGVRF